MQQLHLHDIHGDGDVLRITPHFSGLRVVMLLL
jgi:hypothetical protein